MDLFEISPHLDRAKELIERDEVHYLRYACLELRFCFELIAYRQLSQYGDVIPGSLSKEWKPDRIIRTLASFDPLSDQSGKMDIGCASPDGSLPEEWHAVGNTQAICWREFRKYYNKLGSYLHATRDSGGSKPLQSQSLAKMIADLERVRSATLILATKNIINANCDCGNTVHIGEFEFENDEFAVCGNIKCNALYRKLVTEEGEKVLVPVKVITATCECEAKIPVPLDKVWAPFRCSNCSASYRLNLRYTRLERAE